MAEQRKDHAEDGVSSFNELRTFVVHSNMGERNWQAETMQHAREQHQDAFPDEPILWVRKLIR